MIKQLDKAGRIVIPKAMRDELAWGPGTDLEIETFEDGIIVRPARFTDPQIEYVKSFFEDNGYNLVEVECGDKKVKYQLEEK